MVRTSVSKVPKDVNVQIIRLFCSFSGFKNSWIATYHITKAAKIIIPIYIATSRFLYLFEISNIFNQQLEPNKLLNFIGFYLIPIISNSRDLLNLLFNHRAYLMNAKLSLKMA